MRTAVQGVRGCFSAQAAAEMDAAAELVYCRDFAAVQRAVLIGAADRGLLPVENTLAGEIPGNRDLLAHPGVRVQGETRLRIELCFIVLPGAVEMQSIARVYSHPVAFLQCQNFLRQHPRWVPVKFFDTAGSVEHVLQLGSAENAAVASAAAAEAYGARIALAGIGDRRDNFTSFVIFGAASA